MWVCETALGKGRGVSWIFCLQRTKRCVERMCRHVPGHWAHGHMDWSLSSALEASHSLYPGHRVSSSHVSWRVWSHDLDLANRCVPSSLATVSGSGLGRWPIRAQGRASHWNQGKRRAGSAGRGEAGWGQATAVGGEWVQPGAVGGLPAPRQGRAAGLRRRALLSPGVESAGSCCGPGAPLRPEGGHLPVSPLLLVCQLVWTTLDFLSSWLRGDPGNAPMWILAGFREEMPDDTGRLQFNLDSGHVSWKWSESPSVVSNSWQPHGLYSPWNSAGQNTGVGSLSLLQGIFPVQGLNPGFLQCRKILYQLSPKRSPRILKWVACPFCSGSAFPAQESNQGLLMAGGFVTSWAIREAQYLLRPAIHWYLLRPAIHWYLLRPDINCRIN